MEMISCELDRKSAIPLYEQLYEYIKKEILNGRLPYKAKLPSKRKLAEFLEISQNTIETAYNQLSDEGYVEVIPRRGYFVQAHEDLEYVPKADMPVQESERKEDFIYHFHPGQIDSAYFPIHSWRKLAKQIISEENRELLLLGDPQGEWELRKEIAYYLYHSRGVICTPDQILVGAGMEILLQQLLILLDDELVYGVEDPGYHLIHRLLKTHAKEVYPLAVDEDGLMIEELEQAHIDVAYVTPSHHFPYGTILPVNRRMKLLNWAAEKEGRYIIEDDYDSEFRYSGKSIPSLQSMDQNGKVIYAGSFSKSLMPSIRVSYMVLPTKLSSRFGNEVSLYHSTVSRIDQHILAAFIRQGMFEKHLNRMRKVYRGKLDIVLRVLKGHSDSISLIGGQSGLHVVLVVDNGLSEEALLKKASQAGIKVYPLSSYMLVRKEDMLPTFVLGFAGIEEEKLEEALVALLDCWK
ncbi:MocR-like pyridoxine biosynthesis transcription factor PdxR [Bacillus testis]|uniref:MocR-like pyridoxine biosynthesis transcription factor PdxR n=1 Tax=Bacillus testis TaxID=1622072 RepID=UPI00067E6F86|nr:PLP-dependent aminotransferase family protein [Bacillus testis]